MRLGAEWKGFEPIYYDELTGILNKRFYINIKNILSGEIAMSFFDIDNFKYINDRYGHFTGDAIIKEMGLITGNIVKSGEYPIRFGGDEFIIISARKNPREFETSIENFRKYISSRSFYVNEKSIKITCSFGMAEGKIAKIDDLMQNADSALYCSKDNGKNCVTRYTQKISAKKYLPFYIEREVKKSLAAGKNILIKGGFKSGKTLLKKTLSDEFKSHLFIELTDRNVTLPEKSVCIFYNPIMVMKNRNMIKEINRIKQTEHDEFYLKNLKRNDIVRFYDIAQIKPTIFWMDFLETATSGNLGLLYELLIVKNLKSFNLFNREDIEEALCFIPDDVLKSFQKFMQNGLFLRKEDIFKKKIDLDLLNELSDLMLIEERPEMYVMSYPAFYFHYMKNFGYASSEKWFKLIEISRKIQLADVSNDRDLHYSLSDELYQYGDMDTAMQVLSKFEKHDDYGRKLHAKIYISMGKLSDAKKLISEISDEANRFNLNALESLITGSYSLIMDSNDNYINLLNLSLMVKTLQLEHFNAISGKIDYDNLDFKEKASYLSILGNYHVLKNEFDSALKDFSLCETICKENHLIGDLGKVYMNIGMLNDENGNLFKAMEYYNLAMDIFPYTHMISSIYSLKLNLGVVYSKLGEFGNALDLFSSLLVIDELKNSGFYSTALYNNLADTYLRMFDMKNAEFYNNLLIEQYKGVSNLPDYVGIQYRKIQLMLGKTDFDKLDYFDKDVIINNLDNMLIEFLLSYKNPTLKSVQVAIESLLNYENGKEKFYKAEILSYLCFYFKKYKTIRSYILKKSSQMFLELDLVLRENMLSRCLEEK